MKRNPKILLTLNIFDTLNKMFAYRKHINILYISNEPQVTLFVVNFVFLVSNVCWNFIIFENWGK